MNTFFKYVQPTIVKTSDDIAIREDLRNQYMINFNIFGIDYFEDTYLLDEDDSGNAFYISLEDNSDDSSDENNDAYHIDLESSEVKNVIDLPRIYVVISNKFMNDSVGIFQQFVVKAIENPELFVTGIDNFKAGEDYFINKTLFDYLFENSLVNYDNSLQYILPNYLASTDSTSVYITKYWIDRTGAEDEDYTNMQYYYNKNLVANTYTFSEDELNAFCSTFCQTILDNTLISDETKSEINNQIYDLVLNYWKNYGSDDASVAINLILNSLYSTTTTSTCGCNTSLTSDSTIETTSCYDLYTQAMKTYLIQMLGDSQFYKDWFIANETCDTIVNTGLCDMLITLLNEFISLGYDLSFSSNTSNNCNCKAIDTSASDCNYKILNNYLKVLDWIKNNEIDANVNKIKIFGQQFAEILPNMQF